VSDAGFFARVLTDSISPAGIRLTTLEVRFPRFILSEFNTHRMFCLAAETQLFFDLPAAAGEKGATRRFTMTLREFYEKWHHGAALRRNNGRRISIEHLCLSATYSARELAPLVGFSSYTGVDLLTRRARTPRVQVPEQPYRVRGRDIARWFYDAPKDNRQPMRDRLAAMNLRSCNEETGEIYHTHVRNVCFSGRKDVFRVVLKDGREILSTKDHRFLTRQGWQRLEDAVGLTISPGKIATWNNIPEFAMNGVEAYRDPDWLRARRAEGCSAKVIAEMAGVTVDQITYQFRKHKIPALDAQRVWKRSHVQAPWNKGRRHRNIATRGKRGTARTRRGAESHLWRGGVTTERKRIGRWTVLEAFRTHRSNGFKCVLCGSGRELRAHHLDPVVRNPSRAYDPVNLTTLCEECHRELHERGGKFCDFWGHIGGIRLRTPFVPKKKRAMVRHFVELDRIEYAGERDTYDIEVDGPFHNFVANGFIVHNSRNSASSRAIPTRKLIERIRENPAIPVEWGVNKPGMSASEALKAADAEKAQIEWLEARDSVIEHVEALADLSIHKQVINRLLEPFMWHTVIVTATEWENFFALRLAENAQPEIRVAAQLMQAALDASTPTPVPFGHWHLPLVQDDERDLPIDDLKKISAARCARVSYLTHDGKRDVAKDMELCERLWSDRHMSPFEHVATPGGDDTFHANFRGWIQMRKELE
jgi:5-methylcytosine-specific restriction endonuclease McrA